ncbi:hypothetical protein BYZ73_15545 [Rhodovulum viride]|uniref:Tellurium resistance protein n=1 Tax=Rhodovulum viride TaxID=1231134 RepID=A0ABX9DDF2_9RHOB|nr:TrgA family protein [Rhodovulum viride]RAP40359.1 hypothetical protein BYZ73_15545 [Rhodovulum viride]
MPTAAKLVAFLLYGGLAWAASVALVPSFPEGMDLGHFFTVNAAVGALAGWFVMGRLAGQGYGLAVTAGLRTTVVLVFYALLIHAGARAYARTVEMRFGDPVAAVLGWIGLAADYGLQLFTSPAAMGVLLVGGVLAGLAVEAVSHFWT